METSRNSVKVKLGISVMKMVVSLIGWEVTVTGQLVYTDLDMANTMCAECHVTVIFTRKWRARLQWRQPWATVRVDVTISARHFPRRYDSNLTVFVDCIRPILISLGLQRRNGRVVYYDSALLTSMHKHFSKIPSLRILRFSRIRTGCRSQELQFLCAHYIL